MIKLFFEKDIVGVKDHICAIVVHGIYEWKCFRFNFTLFFIKIFEKIKFGSLKKLRHIYCT
jgi:hypothetical protein